MNKIDSQVIVIIQGDSLTVLKTIPDESINCCVTSPPYWSLRDYGVDGQLGLEKTFEEYITKLCDIFNEVKRVLRKDGTCWVNLGDSYGGNNSRGSNNGRAGYGNEREGVFNKANAKSLCLIPQRFAIEMVNRGWILRNTIIWHKPNCMPSSASDRFTVDFEYLFFFVKSKNYWFEQVFEKYKTLPENRNTKTCGNKNSPYAQSQGDKAGIHAYGNGEQGRNKRCVWTISTRPFPEAHFATFPEALIETPIQAGCPKDGVVLDCFSGAGTTAVVAKKQGKKYIGIEIKQEYIDMANKRIRAVRELLF